MVEEHVRIIAGLFRGRYVEAVMSDKARKFASSRSALLAGYEAITPDAAGDRAALVLDAQTHGRSSTAKGVLGSLQPEQKTHDVGYHADILALPIGRRMSHMALHMCKYAGQFLEAEREGDADRFAHIATDAVIIALACANALELDLYQALDEDVPLPDTRGRRIPDQARRDDDAWFTYRFAAIASRFAKACESQDHGEDFPIVETQIQCTLAFAWLLLREAEHRRLDVPSLVRARWRNVERKIDQARRNHALDA